MILEGDTSVIKAIKEKKRLLDTDAPHEHIRPLLVICGGLMRGVYGGGAVTALSDQGYGEVFDDIIGLSTGAPTAAYFLAGQARLGTSIYYQECASPDFLQGLWLRNWLRRPRHTLRNFLNIDFLQAVFTGSTNKKYDAGAIFKHRTRLHIAVSTESGNAKYIRSSTEEDLQIAVVASCDVPTLNQTKYTLESEVILDALVASAFPTDYITNLNPAPTHILVMTNRPDIKPTWVQRVGDQIVFNGLFRGRCNQVVRNKFISRFAEFDRLYAQLVAGSIPVATVWTDNTIGSLSLDNKVLKETAVRSEQWWLDLLHSD